MPETINWNFLVRVAHGPQVSTASSLDVEAYDKIAVEIAAGGSQQVDLTPGGGEVSLVVINPATPSTDLTYEVGGTAIALDSPHVLLGAGAVALLGAGANSLTFTNNLADPAAIEILVGRDATP